MLYLVCQVMVVNEELKMTKGKVGALAIVAGILNSCV